MKLRRSKPRREQLPKAAEVSAARSEQSPRRFDPRVDLLPEERRLIEQYLYTAFDAKYHGLDSSLGIQLAVLCPELTARLTDDNDIFKGSRDEAERLHDDNWSSYSTYISNLCILYPEHRDELDIQDEDFERIQKSLFNCRQLDDWISYADWAVRAFIIFPERQKQINLDAEAFQGMKKVAFLCAEKEEWLMCMDLIARMCILFPERKAEFELNDTQITRVIAEYQKQINNNNATAAALVADCAMLFTGEVKITEKGIILFDRDILEQAPELPDRNLAQ